MFEGFVSRLNSELRSLAPSSTQVKVVAPPKRQYSAWIGGLMLAALSKFDSMTVKMEEYDEFGPQIIPKMVLEVRVTGESTQRSVAR